MSRLTEDQIYRVTWDANWLRNTAVSDDGHKIFTRIADTIIMLLREREEQADGIAARDGQLKAQAECINRLRDVIVDYRQLWGDGTMPVKLREGDMGEPTS